MQQTLISIGEIFDYLNPACDNQTSLLRLLRKMLVKLAVASSEDQLYEHVGYCFHEVVPDSTVLINSFNETSNLFQLRAIISRGTRIQRLTTLLGINPLGMSLPIDEKMATQLRDGRVKKVEDGLAGIFKGAVLNEYCLMLQKYFNISDVYMVGLSCNRSLLGSTNILIAANGSPPDVDLVHSMVAICSSVLYQKFQATIPF
jgi:hypothetical protein